MSHSDWIGICDGCDKECPLTRHHLIPQCVTKKGVKGNGIIGLCFDCHGLINKFVRPRDMAIHYNTKQAIRGLIGRLSAVPSVKNFCNYHGATH